MTLDVSGLPPVEQFPAWAVTLHPFQAETPEPNDGFEARTEAWLIEPIVVSVAKVGPARIWRSRDRLGDGLDGLTFQLFLSGTMQGLAAGRPFDVRVGDIAMQDASQPWDSVIESSSTIVVNMPRAFLDDVLPDFDVHGLVLRGGMAAALAAFVGTLPELLSSSTPAGIVELPRLLRDLLAAALRQTAVHADIGSARDKMLRGQIRRYISRNLDKRIGAIEICNALGVARTSVYRALQQDGGVATFIQRQRLAKIRRLLTNPAETRPITTLAHHYGFQDMSHFNRVFRQAFGISPGAHRRGLSAPSSDRAGNTQERFLDWVDKLDRG